MRISDWSSDVCSSDLAAMYHILAAKGQGQYGASDRKNQPPQVTSFGIAADAPRRIELAVAVHARVGGVEQQMEFARSRGRLDSLAADHDMAGARLQPKPVERRFPQCRGDQRGQIVGDRTSTRLNSSH